MPRTAPRFFALALPLLGLAACATTPPLPPQETFQCTAEPAAWAIGKAPTDDVVERIRQDTHSRVTRVIHPNDAITMDYSGARVNIKVNERNAIVGISCG
jgi:hypothetical protein